MTYAAQSRGSSKEAPEMLPYPHYIYISIDAAEMFKQQDIHWQQGQSAFKRLGSAEKAERGSCLQRAKETTISLGSALSQISGNSVACSHTQSSKHGAKCEAPHRQSAKLEELEHNIVETVSLHCP